MEPPSSSRGRRRPTGGKLRTTTPTHALSPHRGIGTHQSDQSIRSPPQPASLARGAIAAPRSNQAPAPHQPHQDAHSVASNRHRARHGNDVCHMAAGNIDPGRTIEGSGETRPRRDRWLDNQSPSPKGPGPWAFSRRIRRAPFPNRFWPPSNITKYTRETNLGIWLEDFRLAY